ncbi:hypothetical protein [Alteribacter natronophilus]|uniref:hypothetical protein n=1 Tax=Alteribacter natronophilus TaxID=2583810 RepID=UPI00110D38D8|nr:hypothetical protein [Alteribacter natronophilus]TMW71063.1 hypothetical protein FGB90_13925 [Alteribacter natronophilus]
MKVITLCGSTKFKDAFREMEKKLTLQGHAAISLGFFEQSEGVAITPEQEAMFEKIHLRKIDLADEIFVIDVDGYVGKSTANEIHYAKSRGKAVNYYSQIETNSLSHS